MRRPLLASCAVAVVLVACGSRGPLDDSPLFGDAGGGADASVDATPAVDARRVFEAGPAACASCVLTTCGEGIVECLGASDCIGVFSCVATTCLAPAVGDGGGGGGGGGLNTQCLLGCAASNPGGALQVLQIFQCVSGTCGSDCGSLLGGLGGGLGGLGGLLGGGGGGGGGGGPGGAPEELPGPIDRAAFGEVFSPWPELTSRAAR